jgi:hypothetical protein
LPLPPTPVTLNLPWNLSLQSDRPFRNEETP